MKGVGEGGRGKGGGGEEVNGGGYVGRESERGRGEARGQGGKTKMEEEAVRKIFHPLFSFPLSLDLHTTKVWPPN